ncbi:hypothetical protein [Spirilliplanes yamanashiensis]|uniref:Uncharacterized protein n=1 Tax=Spirilliplanes yamanashiensis TaxID=42233 RepID=A0A8J4DHK2_9ACTN|nr:hypothetical protein [Spirilliplanes yamanashiensis]MDP9819260.1 hypothetical protein [Spirilliplanes yamanashiensis]GIJ01916.1 hypothetical protein Sya03_12680 [Spirilliplanes yamanashiensis]
MARRHRRRTSGSAAVAVGAVVLVVGGAVVWWRAGGSPPAETGCRLPAVGAPTAAAAPDAPDGGAVRVAERGFTQESRDLDGEPDGRADRISMGAVVENTSTRVAYRTRVTFAVTAADGDPAADTRQRSWLVQEVPIILPGQRTAVGVAVLPTRDGDGAATRAATMTVALAVTQWLPADGFATVTAAAVPGAATRDDHGTGTVDYDATSAWCAPLKPRGTALVFRDRAGELVGGDLVLDGSAQQCAPGVTRQRAATNPQAVPSTADIDRTEVTEHCDLAPATGLIPGSVVPSGVPIN